MAEYLAPGVYVEEVSLGSKPIEGVSTSTAGFLGVLERGPVEPRLVTALTEFHRLYGGFTSGSYLPYAVDGFFTNGGKRCFIARVCGKNNRRARLEIPAVKAGGDGGGAGKAVIEAIATGPGEWGNRIAVKIEDASLSTDAKRLFKMSVLYWSGKRPDPMVDPTDPSTRRDPNRREPAVVEVYDNLSSEPSSSDYYEKQINNVSALIEVARRSDGDPSASALVLLEGGADGQDPKLADYQGDLAAGPGERTGLAALSEISEISILCVPDENEIDGLANTLLAHCEREGDRFAVLQTAQSAGPIGDLRPVLDSKYAAVYYPWIRVMDPVTHRPKLVPPGGHITGIYARSDTERGVHKAPANETVRGALGVQFQLTKGDQAILNPRGVNCIRAFPGRGIRVWGARTVSSDPEWKYVNVRRLFLYLESSIEAGTQWVVFEPNNHQLWARVVQSVTDFLTRVWRDGALMGVTAEQAFFVRCDETTMTQNDIENGRLVILVGVAPTRPAEFVIFRISQWQSAGEVTE